MKLKLQTRRLCLALAAAAGIVVQNLIRRNG